MDKAIAGRIGIAKGIRHAMKSAQTNRKKAKIGALRTSAPNRCKKFRHKPTYPAHRAIYSVAFCTDCPRRLNTFSFFLFVFWK